MQIQLLCGVSQTLESGVIEFIDENGGGPGARLTEHTAILADAHGAKSPGPRINILKEVPVNCLIMMDAEASDG